MQYQPNTTISAGFKPFTIITGNKKSFLVYKQKKYLTVPIEKIAYFYIKFDATIIVTIERQEYTIDYSLDQVQHMVSGQQFYRVNRQHLVNFSAIKEVEHFFARKLLVKLIIPVTAQLLVSKEKAHQFLRWLENR